MRTIVHLSDLHFGSVDAALLEPLSRAVHDLKPHLVVISGDLTQRARAGQFLEARAWLDTLPEPRLVVPGNHDVPLYNVFMRFFAPLRNYRRYIGENTDPHFADDEIAVSGVNTARSLTFKGGRINEEQVERVRAHICNLPDEVTKIVVTHHPFDAPAHASDNQIVGRARMAIRKLAECGADLYLSGHMHESHTGHTAERYGVEGHSALVVQAGTATSTRGRGESNSFNVIRVKHPQVSVERHSWSPDRGTFGLFKTETFEHTRNGWTTGGGAAR
jgi:3',5'-cyclic AMP phosphodiesterase CpdA